MYLLQSANITTLYLQAAVFKVRLFKYFTSKYILLKKLFMIQKYEANSDWMAQVFRGFFEILNIIF